MWCDGGCGLCGVMEDAGCVVHYLPWPLSQTMKSPRLGPQLFTTATNPVNQTKNLFSYALPCTLKQYI